MVAVRLATAVRDESGKYSPPRPTEERVPEKRTQACITRAGTGSIISARPDFDWPRRYLDHLIKIGDPSDSKNHRLVV